MFSSIRLALRNDMKARILVMNFVLAALFCVGINVHATSSFHPVHFTTTWIKHDPATQTVSITIEVYGDEFVWAVGEHAKRAIKLERLAAGKSAEDIRVVMAYVKDKFELKDSAGHGIALEWVKLVKREDMLRVHLKGKLPKGLKGATLRNLLLCETDEDQVNTVFTQFQKEEIKTSFVDKDGFKPLTEKPQRN